MHSVASSKTIARFQCHAVPSPIFIWIATSSRRTTTKRRGGRQSKRSQSFNNTTCRTYLRVLCLSACLVRPSVLSVCHRGSALSLPPTLSLSLSSRSLPSLSLSLSLSLFRSVMTNQHSNKKPPRWILYQRMGEKDFISFRDSLGWASPFACKHHCVNRWCKKGISACVGLHAVNEGFRL